MQFMNARQPLPKLTEQQWAQQDLFIDGLVHFLDVAGRIQDTVARHEKLQSIHLAFLRRANIRGFVSYDRITADMRTEKYVVSRAGALLRKRQLGDVMDVKNDGRYRRFVINRKGRKVINGIDFEIARRMALKIGTADHNSRRYYLFTEALCDLRSFLPWSGPQN